MPGNGESQVTPERIMQLAWGYAPPLIVEAALRHRVFDVLDSGAKTVQEVEAATRASTRGLTAIMNALVGLDLLSKDAEGKYALTPESAAFLVSTKPGFSGGMIRHCSEQLIPKWLSLSDIVATGQPHRAVNQEQQGGEFFQNFVEDIFNMSYAPAKRLAEELALNNSNGPVIVLDLAAGSGVWGIALAQSSERVRVTAVDWPEVIPTYAQNRRPLRAGRSVPFRGRRPPYAPVLERIIKSQFWDIFFTVRASHPAVLFCAKPSTLSILVVLSPLPSSW